MHAYTEIALNSGMCCFAWWAQRGARLQVVAHGSYHSDEGIQLEKFSLEAGEN